MCLVHMLGFILIARAGTNGQDYRILHLPEQYEEWISAEIIWANTT